MFGFDVSKDKLDVYLHTISEAFSFTNSKAGITKMIKLFSTYSVEQVVCESTGGYENCMLGMLHKTGYSENI